MNVFVLFGSAICTKGPHNCLLRFANKAVSCPSLGEVRSASLARVAKPRHE